MIIFADKKVKPLPEGTPVEQMRALARLRKRPEIRRIYDAIMGVGEPLDLITSSNTVEGDAIADDLTERLMAHLQKHPSNVARLTRPIGTTPALSPVLRINEHRKMMAAPKGASVHIIGGLRVFPVPGDMLADVNMQLEYRALVFGPDVRDVIARMATPMRGRRLNHGGQGVVSLYDATDRDAIQRGISSIVSPNFAMPVMAPGDSDVAFPQGWNDDEARAERNLIEFFLMMLMPMHKKLMASGAGLPMLTAALAQSDYRLRSALKGKKPALHRDRLIQFVANELRRLGMSHVSIPVVEHR